jgi:hypothetical protein
MRKGDVLQEEIGWEVLNASDAGRARSISQNREEYRNAEETRLTWPVNRLETVA